jgi:hypothetical protein
MWKWKALLPENTVSLLESPTIKEDIHIRGKARISQ